MKQQEMWRQVQDAKLGKPYQHSERGFDFTKLHPHCLFDHHTGVIMNYQPKQCNIKGKSPKFTIHLGCLIPPKCVIQWCLSYFTRFTPLLTNSLRARHCVRKISKPDSNRRWREQSCATQGWRSNYISTSKYCHFSWTFKSCFDRHLL